MYESLKGKKLLVLGSSEVDANIVNVAHELGVYVVVVDGIKKSTSTFAKNIADESWDIDYTHTEEIGEKCLKSGINGVLAGYSEFRVSAACKIANYIGSPFYATLDQIELTRNKRRFKDTCRKFDVHVPFDYEIQSLNNIDNIIFPVIVKPTDAAGRKGITICYNEDQLKNAVDLALEYSFSKTIIIEEYVFGKEFVAVYTIQDGNCSLSCFNEKYLNEEYSSSGLCDLALSPSSHMQNYIDKAHSNVCRFLSGIGAQNGVAFFQGISTKDDIYLFEMGYRLNGGNDYFITEEENGISYMKMLISHSLTGKMIGDLGKDNPSYSKYYANFLIYSHGGKVGDIEFHGDIKEKEGLRDIHIKKSKGMIIKEDGTTQQGVFTFKLSSRSIKELIELIHYCQVNTEVTDEFGNSLLFRPFNTERLKENYGIISG